MLTVDFDRLGLRPGDRVLDMGCGAGRHAFEMYKRGADVIAFDQDADELATVREWFAAMREAGEVPAGAEADVKEGDALALPFADGEFDRIVAAEVLEHIHADVEAIKELVRVLRPGGTLAVSVPRWLPEVVNWKLSDDYHNAEGGHIRIYTVEELVDKVTKAGRANDGTPGDAMVFTGKGYAHGLHAPYWWIKCAVGVDQRRPPARQGVPPAPGLGDHEEPALAAAGRQGPRPADRQEPGALLPQAGMTDVPALDGILTRAQVEQTAASIEAVQEPSGAIPWSRGEHTDVWNHLESAMGLLVGGRREAAERAFAWVRDTQRADGSWPMKIVAGEVEDHSGESNMSAYVAVATWHHWLVTPRRGVRTPHVADRAARARLRRVPAAAVRRHRVVAGVARRRPGDRQRGGAARRVVEHPPLAPRRRRAGRAGGGAAGRVGAGRRPAGPRAARAPRPLPGQVDLLDGLVLPGPRRRRPRRRGARDCSPSGGTRSSSPAWASGASRPTRG